MPLTPKGISIGHVSLTESGFNVGKVDLGPITRRVKEGKTFYAYDANQLDDINASAILYNEGAVENGTWDATKGNKTISAIGYNSKYWYGIQEGTPTNFTSKYTYSGAVLPRATNGNVFYFSRDKYVALRNLRDPNLYVYPFRAVYAFDAGSVSPAKLFTSFVVSMDDFNSHVTGIDAVSGAKGLKITAGKNEIAVSTDVTTPLHIVNIAGQTFVNTTLKAGSSATYHLPADVYLVNRQKVIIY